MHIEKILDKIETFLDRLLKTLVVHKKITVYIPLILLAMAEFRLLQLIHLKHWNFRFLLSMNENILSGTPVWRAFQNRLMGPYITHSLSKIVGISTETATLIVIFMLLLLIKLLFFRHMLFLTKSCGQALLYTFMLACLYLILQFHKYIFLYDLLDLAVFVVFVILVTRNRHVLWLIVLFLIGLLNRESILFVMLWVMIDSFNTDEDKRLRIKRIYFTAACVLLAAGIWYTGWIRETLFITSSIESVGLDPEHEFIENHIYLKDNLINFFLRDWNGTEILMKLFIGGIPLLMLYYNVKCRTSFILKLSILTCGMLASVWIFGWIKETRLLFNLLPILLTLHHHYLNCERRRLENA